EGPPSLPVEGDASKVARIVQNLLLNALKYTRHGGVTVTWGDSLPNDAERWLVRVRDTGPGFPEGGGVPLATALEEATQEARQIEGHPPAGPAHAAPPRPARDVSFAESEPHGEGIGLSIVKRICEILDATLELESDPGRGTTVSVILPRRYADGGAGT
ncbi:MAG TPA: ATP-binding protein, partial [Vicinamibacteria bacterium]